jgi:D-aminoacyl-tRNA deacylase
LKVVLQRVKNASVSVDGQRISGVGHGLLLLVGVAKGDEKATADWLAEKVAGLRVFTDADSKMNLDVREIDGKVLAVSQFTLLADTRKGKRPSFVNAAPPGEAEHLFNYFCEKLRAAGVRSVETGAFGAMMDVELLNHGPVTIVLER